MKLLLPIEVLPNCIICITMGGQLISSINLHTEYSSFHKFINRKSASIIDQIRSEQLKWILRALMYITVSKGSNS